MSTKPADAQAGARNELIKALKQAGRSNSEQNRKALAHAIVGYRVTFTNNSGRPDVTGKSYEYRTAYRAAREAAKALTQEYESILQSLRYYTGDEARKFIRGMATDEDEYQELCKEYGMKPESTNARRVDAHRVQRGIAYSRTVGGKTVLALLDSAREHLQADVTAERAGTYRRPRDMDAETVEQLATAAESLAALIPDAVRVWRAHAND